MGSLGPMKLLTLAALVVLVVPVFARAESVIEKTKAELIAADQAFCDQAQKVGFGVAFNAVACDQTKLLDVKVGVGLEVVRKAYANWPANAKITWVVDAANSSAAGDLGYTYGRWEFTQPGKDGKVVHQTGSYVTIWRRQADGGWKVVLDGGPSDS